MFIWLYKINIISYLNKLLGEHKHLEDEQSVYITVHNRDFLIWYQVYCKDIMM